MARGGLQITLIRTCSAQHKVAAKGLLGGMLQMTKQSNVSYWALTAAAMKQLSASVVRETILNTHNLDYILGCTAWFMALQKENTKLPFFDAMDRAVLQCLAAKTKIPFSEWRQLFSKIFIGVRTTENGQVSCAFLSTQGVDARTMAFVRDHVPQVAASAFGVDIYAPGKLSSAVCLPGMSKHPCLNFFKPPSTGIAPETGFHKGDVINCCWDKIQGPAPPSEGKGNCTIIVDFLDCQDYLVADTQIAPREPVVITKSLLGFYKHPVYADVPAPSPNADPKDMEQAKTLFFREISYETLQKAELELRSIRESFQELQDIAKECFLAPGAPGSEASLQKKFKKWLSSQQKVLQDGMMNFSIAVVAAKTNIKLENTIFSYLEAFKMGLKWFV